MKLGARGCMYCEGDKCTKECVEDKHSPLHEFTQKKLMGIHNPLIREHITTGIRYGSEWEKGRSYNDKEVRDICLNFFYHWYNSPGNNTEQGFDEWFKENKKK